MQIYSLENRAFNLLYLSYRAIGDSNHGVNYELWHRHLPEILSALFQISLRWNEVSA
jgi:hypothetical protein